MASPIKVFDPALAGTISTSDLLEFGKIARKMEVDVVHELGTAELGLPVTEYRIIPPSPFPTHVTIRSQVGQAISQPTDEYIATVRRRKARRLADSLTKLAEYQDQSDFTAWTFPILEQIKEMILFLADSAQEGNTREILRQLRDTFMNGGWEAYRRSDSRVLAITIVENLAAAVEITPKNANESFDKLLKLGLNPVGNFVCSSQMSGDQSDDEED